MCGLLPDELENFDVSYLHHRWIGTCYRLQIEERSKLEVARYHAMFVVNGYAKKGVKKPTDLGKFPWEQPKPKQLKKDKANQLKEYAKTN